MSTSERETILVVDDIPANISMLAATLDPEYRVTFATRGADALMAALSHPQPSLILLDVMMPGMDGYETCRRLKADLRTQNIPVVFLTAQNDVIEEEIGLKLGAVDYLHKPCHPAIVRQRVRIHLELHNQNLALEERVRERTRELEETRIEIVRRLGRAGEYRDNETGMHVVRMSQCCHRLALVAGPAQAELRVVAPKCEYAADPLGIDVAQPRLSWCVESDERGQRQTAYRILVASSAELLVTEAGGYKLVP